MDISSVFQIKNNIEQNSNKTLSIPERIRLINSLQSKKSDKNNKILRPYQNKDVNIKQMLIDLDKEKQEKGVAIVKESNRFNNISRIFNNYNSIKKITRVTNPSLHYKSVYVLLDTNNASDVLSEGTRYRWNFRPDAVLLSGSVNGLGVTNKLIGMRIYPMKTDVKSEPSDTFTGSGLLDVISGPGLPELYYNDFTNLNSNFTILIEEFQSQAYVGREGRKFHFVLFPFLMETAKQFGFPDWTPLNPYYEFVTSGKGNGQFWFKNPITEFSTLTISMGNPFNIFPLSKITRTLIPLEFIFLDE